MQTDWQKARNHYLAMAMLAVVLSGLVGLVDPGIASAVVLPAMFFAAQSAGSKFAILSGRAMQRGEALRLAVIAAALQVGIGLGGIGLGMMLERGQIVAVHYGAIAGLLVAAALASVLVTWAGLWFGARVILRRGLGAGDG
jgi:predicted MFS family arabinose efflux permease